jgi:hypothetical protein
MKRWKKMAGIPVVLCGAMALLVSSAALAQQPAPPPAPKPAPAPAPAPVPPPPAVAPVEPPPAPPPVEPAPIEPAPAPPPVVVPPEAAPPPVPPPGPEPMPEPEPAPSAKPWYDAITFGAFADAYAGVNYNFPKPQSGKNAFRAYDTANGFSLAWAGVNASYNPDPVGGTIQLRFGPSTVPYNSLVASESQNGLQYLKQAFASWKPGGAESALQLDFGKFDTIYGAEVADSYQNQNYTRGVLYWLGQPLFHTGLRATYQASEAVAVKAMVVNGWNNTIDNNAGKSYGLQLALTPAEGLAAYIGWLGGPEQTDTADVCPAGSTETDGACTDTSGAAVDRTTIDRGGANDVKAWKHLIDFVLTYSINENLGLVFNADYGTEGLKSLANSEVTRVKWYGAMLGLKYQIDPVWAVGARGEYYVDADGYTTATGIKDLALATGTLTFEAKPTANLILRLDARGDFAVGGDEKEVFSKKMRDLEKGQLTTTLGVVVTTN